MAPSNVSFCTPVIFIVIDKPKLFVLERTMDSWSFSIIIDLPVCSSKGSLFRGKGICHRDVHMWRANIALIRHPLTSIEQFPYTSIGEKGDCVTITQINRLQGCYNLETGAKLGPPDGELFPLCPTRLGFQPVSRDEHPSIWASACVGVLCLAVTPWGASGERVKRAYPNVTWISPITDNGF